MVLASVLSEACSTIMFEVRIMSCLEYLEAILWFEEEEDKVVSCFSQKLQVWTIVGIIGGVISEMAREDENLQWMVDILINKRMGGEFEKLWVLTLELIVLHSKIPNVFEHEISKITAHLCIAIRRGQVLVPKDTRCSLLSTWLEGVVLLNWFDKFLNKGDDCLNLRKAFEIWWSFLNII
ncbi:hypothetical protein K2173_023584 [Erythroxylum novogranatense]|uniref:At3g05675-like ankyrin-like domain-containing protein n=1 Tax=Erythroxylum novogranatense TaxID=1862640 RepID=A0AAV8TQZ2_9ROSI|nr:hypothetical protein K2173_023584 [Erythroxylum novogranatense]